MPKPNFVGSPNIESQSSVKYFKKHDILDENDTTGGNTERRVQFDDNTNTYHNYIHLLTFERY